MLPFLVGAVAFAVLSRDSREREESQVPGQLIIELDTTLPPQEVAQVIEAIRMATPATVVQLDALSNVYRQRGMPLTAYELSRRAWDVRGRLGPPPAPPHPDAGAPMGQPSSSPPVGCLDAASDPAMCAAVTSALLTETHPDKLHAFAETLRGQYPHAAEALDAKAMMFGAEGGAAAGRGAPSFQASGMSNGGPPHHAHGASPQTQPWVDVASDYSNVPPQYHGALAAMLQQLAHDASMTPGSERAVTVGDRMFVFVKPPPAPDLSPATVWVTRMAVGPSDQTASTGYGSGPLWPVDIVDGRMVPPDRRYMGSPTIWDPASSLLSPPAPMQTVLMPGPPGPAVQTVYVGGGAPGYGAGQSSVSDERGNDGERVPMYVPSPSLAAQVAAMPQGVAFARGEDGGVPGIMGASKPEIVGGDPSVMQQAAIASMQAEAEQQQLLQAQAEAELQMQAQVEAEQQRSAMQAAAEQAMASQAQGLDGRAPHRPRPATYVVLRPSDRVWPETLAKIGSGNRKNLSQLVALNPHLVSSSSGVWQHLVPGDEVCIPPAWVDNMRARGFLVKSD